MFPNTLRSPVQIPWSAMAVVERESERSTLRRILATVGEPGAQAISVVGVPGIGKSTLVGLAVAECTDWLVLTARGTPLGAQVPHGVLVQLFAGLARSTEAGEPPFDGPGGMIRELMVYGAVGADSAALSYALHWVVARLAESRRVLVVVDDLHWADPASRSILGHAMGLLGSESVGFLFGVRRGHPDDVGGGTHGDRPRIDHCRSRPAHPGGNDRDRGGYRARRRAGS